MRWETNMSVRRFGLALLALVALAIGLAFALSGGAGVAQARGQPAQIVSGFGLASVEGQPLYIHVTVVVPAGENAQAAVARELAGRGAQPISREAFSLTGFKMDTPPSMMTETTTTTPTALLSTTTSAEFPLGKTSMATAVRSL